MPRWYCGDGICAAVGGIASTCKLFCYFKFDYFFKLESSGKTRRINQRGASLELGGCVVVARQRDSLAVAVKHIQIVL